MGGIKKGLGKPAPFLFLGALSKRCSIPFALLRRKSRLRAETLQHAGTSLETLDECEEGIP